MHRVDLANLFSDGKASDAMRTIGEVSKALRIKPHVLRYWEQQFAMLTPLKRSGNRRLYRPEDIALVAEIDRLIHREGYTLKGARAALQAARQMPDNPADVPAHNDAQIIPQLRAIRERLARALAT